MDRSGIYFMRAMLILASVFIIVFWADTRYRTVQTAAIYDQPMTVVVDAGHGGEDGGTTSVSGVLESRLNLEIALKMRDLLELLGVRTVTVRESDISVYTGDCQTLSQKKVSDLKNRVALVNNTPNALVLSIHQNYFEQPKYRGAQVFYAKTQGSKALAALVQASIAEHLDPDNRRAVKQAASVYLMEHIERTGILIECGFLSNYEEDRLLQSPQYQKKLSLAVCSAVVQYMTQEAERYES